ncbi:MAG: hypothetical protein AAF944_04595 [Bacteroidota bacterium]
MSEQNKDLFNGPINEGNIGIRLEHLRQGLKEEQQKEEPDKTVIAELSYEIERHEQAEKELGFTQSLTPEQQRIQDLEREQKKLTLENAYLKKEMAATASIVDTVLEMKRPSLLMLDNLHLNKMRAEAEQHIDWMKARHPDLPSTHNLGDPSTYDAICQDIHDLWTNLALDIEEYNRVIGEADKRYIHFKVNRRDKKGEGQ